MSKGFYYPFPLEMEGRKLWMIAFKEEAYYDWEEIQHQLNKKSAKGYGFRKLLELVAEDRNLMLAHRKIKANKGSKTPGVDNENVQDFKDKVLEEYLIDTKFDLLDYRTDLVRRKEIPKPNGGVRPLGISCYEDKIIEAAIKQVIEPILEAKFHPDSYGFRPGRSPHDAIGMCQTLIRAGYTYACEFDIRKCFDNINHRFVRKKLWACGIRDTRILTIISKRLRACVYDPKTGVISQSTIGTVQGGELSPLLANVILNDLDWWIARQWERFDIGLKDESEYKNHNVWQATMWRKLRKTKLKAGRIVRFADDFVIFCKTRKEAVAWYYAVKDWMKRNLKLEISEEKSRIVDLTKDSIVFLGFEIKANKEGKSCTGRRRLRGKVNAIKYTKTSISPKNIDKIVAYLRSKMKEIINSSDIKIKITLLALFNVCLLGYHNYWNIASECSSNFYQIHKRLKSKWKKLKKQADSKTNISSTFHKLYGDYVQSAFSISGLTVYPIWGCKHKTIQPKSRNYNYYDKNSDLTELVKSQLKIICRNYIPNKSVEYNDNRLSRYSMQIGRDALTGKFLLADEVHCHHITMVSKGGSDKFDNLVIVSHTTHKWIHDKMPDIPNLTKERLEKLNEFRVKCGREPLKNKKITKKQEN